MLYTWYIVCNEMPSSMHLHVATCAQPLYCTFVATMCAAQVIMRLNQNQKQWYVNVKSRCTHSYSCPNTLQDRHI